MEEAEGYDQSLVLGEANLDDFVCPICLSLAKKATETRCGISMALSQRKFLAEVVYDVCRVVTLLRPSLL